MCKERTGFNKLSSCPVFTFGKKMLPVSINVNINKITKQQNNTKMMMTIMIDDDDVEVLSLKTCIPETNINWKNTVHCFHPNQPLR